VPTTDNYGQNIAIPALTDAPNAATLGNGLAAIVPQSVMRFASASARNATITSPVAGMQAWLTTEKLMTMYDGTSWTVMAAGASAWTTLSLAATFGHDGNSNGNCQYRLLNFFGEMSVQLRGGLNIPYTDPGGLIANGGIFTATPLPTSARPSSLRTTPGACSAVSSGALAIKIDAQTSGHLLAGGTGGTDKPPWVSLNGILYSL
jgi:hypothetical protein